MEYSASAFKSQELLAEAIFILLIAAIIKVREVIFQGHSTWLQGLTSFQFANRIVEFISLVGDATLWFVVLVDKLVSIIILLILAYLKSRDVRVFLLLLLPAVS